MVVREWWEHMVKNEENYERVSICTPMLVSWVFPENNNNNNNNKIMKEFPYCKRNLDSGVWNDEKECRNCFIDRYES